MPLINEAGYYLDSQYKLMYTVTIRKCRTT
jgi:hypothetical protein